MAVQSAKLEHRTRCAAECRDARRSRFACTGGRPFESGPDIETVADHVESSPLKISVITAAYKSEATVGEAIASVAAQTHPDLEHLVIEGNSEDGTFDAIERSAHDRMRLISEPDKGIYDALNKGIRNATGDVIGFLHSDDFLAHDGVLARIAAAFEDPAVEAVFSDLIYVSQADTSRVIRHWSTGPFHPQRLKYGWIPTLGWCFLVAAGACATRWSVVQPFQVWR